MTQFQREGADPSTILPKFGENSRYFGIELQMGGAQNSEKIAR